ncbi:MAG: transglycosylase domain-containing protein, partial [Candidatus Dormibacteraceae bacterium]
SPLINSDQARARQAEVLDAMVRQGMITQDQSDRARVEKLDLHYPPNSIKAAPQFVSWIVKHLIAQYGARAAYSGGLHVVTSLNPTLQGIAESAVANNVSRVQQAGHNMHQGAMTSIDPATGEVLAMVGSVPNQPGSSYNFAADEPVNPGSTVKLFTYTAAIASGKYTMVTDVPDAPITVNMPGQDRNYSPKNYDSSSFPKCVFQTCMGNSLNIPAVYVEISTGVDKVIDMARQLGAPPKYPLQLGGPFSSTEPASDFGATFTLGGYPETPLLMSTATATIADKGIYHPATGILRVTAVDGTEIRKYDPAAEAKPVLDPKVAYIMAAIMSNNDNRKEIFGSSSENLLLSGHQVAAKTGTSESFRDEWTLGFTPKLASAFWFGNPDNRPISTTAQSYDAIFGAAPGWKDFMSHALDALHAPASDWYTPPSGLSQPSPGVWLMPGTDQHQPTPHLPSWASIANQSKPDAGKPPPNPPAPTPGPGGGDEPGSGGRNNGPFGPGNGNGAPFPPIGAPFPGGGPGGPQQGPRNSGAPPNP